MQVHTLAGNTRQPRGKGGARQARREGNVPAVLYGHDLPPVQLSINAREFVRLIHAAHGEHAIVQLEFADKPDLNGPALLKDVQHDPVKGQAIHADFLRISLDEKVRTTVQVVLVGRSKGMQDGGLLDHQLREIEVECRALEIPSELTLNVTELGIGDSFHVGDISAPEGVEILTPADRAVVAIHAPRVVKSDAELAAEAAAAEAAAGVAAAEAADKTGAKAGDKTAAKAGDKGGDKSGKKSDK